MRHGRKPISIIGYRKFPRKISMKKNQPMLKQFTSMWIYEVLFSFLDSAGTYMKGLFAPARGRLASIQFQMVLGGKNE